MERKTQVPDGWEVVRLGDVARERNQRANSTPRPEVFSVTKHAGLVRSLEYFDRQVFSRDTSNYKIVQRGDLAYATIHLDEGSLGILRDADTGLISPMYTVFEVNRARAEPEFLFSLMKLPQMVSLYQRIGEGSVHRRKSIGFDSLGRLSFAIPPLVNQRHILAVLDSIDEAIERTDAVIAATERLRDALLHELLTRGVPGWHSEWKEAPGIGTVPACWEVAHLGDMAERITKGTTPTTLGREYSQTGVRFLRVGNVTDGGTISEEDQRFIDDDTHTMLSRSVLRENDFVLSIAGTLGRSALITRDILPANVNQALAIIRLAIDAQLLPKFLSLVLRGNSIRLQIEDMRVELAQANISLQQVKALRVALPSDARTTTYCRYVGRSGRYDRARKSRNERAFDSESIGHGRAADRARESEEP